MVLSFCKKLIKNRCFFNWVIFVDRGAPQNAGPDSGERVEAALRRPWIEATIVRRKWFVVFD